MEKLALSHVSPYHSYRLVVGHLHDGPLTNPVRRGFRNETASQTVTREVGRVETDHRRITFHNQSNRMSCQRAISDISVPTDGTKKRTCGDLRSL